MPTTFAFNRGLSSIVMIATGVVTWDERMRAIRIAERVLAGSTVRNVLVDLSGLSKENDPEEAMAFRSLLKEKREIFRTMRIAVVRSTEFPLSSVHAHELRKFGMSVVEFDADADARAWLAEQEAAAGTSQEATPDEPIEIW